MRAFKKLFVTGLIACTAVIGGAALWSPITDGKNASAEETQASVTQAYTTQDIFFMARVTNVYAPNGNFNLTISMSEYDATVQQAEYTFSKDLTAAFNQFNFFDKVKIGEKTLRELGCTGFWNNAMDIGVSEPKKVINLHCHADPEIWQAAINNGEVAFSSPSCPITMEEGMLLPGFSYLTDGANPVVYRAAHTTVSTPKAGIAYDMENYVQAEIESLQYTTEWDATYSNAYLGISFVGDDYLGDGTQVEANGNWFKSFGQNILVNGESDKVATYGLYNLGAAGEGHFSFVIRVPEAECTSITIPKGSLFPTRIIDEFYTMNGNPVFFYYQTVEDVTFYKSSNGEFISLAKLKEEKITQLQTLRATKIDEECFSADVAVMNEAMSNAIDVIHAESDETLILQAFEAAKAVLDSVQPKTEAVNAAKAELDAYKADEIYFTETDSAARMAILETAKTAIDNAESSDAISTIVATAKEEVDALPSKGAMIAEKEVELDGYKAEEGYYREAEAAQRAEIIATAKTNMDAAASAAEIDEIVANAKTAIDGLTTNAEYTAKEEEIADNKQAALSVVNTAKAEIKTWLYTQEDLTKINTLYSEVKQAIENTTDKAVMDKAAEDFVAELSKISPQIEEETDEKAGGCGGAISVGAACMMLGVCGLVVFTKKKEN